MMVKKVSRLAMQTSDYTATKYLKLIYERTGIGSVLIRHKRQKHFQMSNIVVLTLRSCVHFLNS